MSNDIAIIGTPDFNRRVAGQGWQRRNGDLLPPGQRQGPNVPIRTYLQDNSAFEPEAITAMSEALEQTCKALHISGQVHDREVIAARIIDLARNGVIDAAALSRRVLAELKSMRLP